MRKVITLILSSALVLSTPLALAKKQPDKAKPPIRAIPTMAPPSQRDKVPPTLPATLKLYKSPSEKAKVIKTIKRDDPLTQMKTDWIKVKNLRTGDEGWIKQSDLKKSTHQPFLYRTSIEEKIGGEGDHGYRIIEYSGTQDLNEKEVHKMMKDMFHHEQTMQHDMQQMFDMDYDYPIIIIPGNGYPHPMHKKDKPAGWWKSLKDTLKSNDK